MHHFSAVALSIKVGSGTALHHYISRKCHLNESPFCPPPKCVTSHHFSNHHSLISRHIALLECRAISGSRLSSHYSPSLIAAHLQTKTIRHFCPRYYIISAKRVLGDP